MTNMTPTDTQHNTDTRQFTLELIDETAPDYYAYGGPEAYIHLDPGATTRAAAPEHDLQRHAGHRRRGRGNAPQQRSRLRRGPSATTWTNTSTSVEWTTAPAPAASCRSRATPTCWVTTSPGNRLRERSNCRGPTTKPNRAAKEQRQTMTQPKTPEFQCQAPRMSFIVTIEGTEDQTELENAVAAIGGTLRWVAVEDYNEYDGEGAYGEEWLWSSIEEWLEGLEEDDDGEYEPWSKP